MYDDKDHYLHRKLENTPSEHLQFTKGVLFLDIKLRNSGQCCKHKQGGRFYFKIQQIVTTVILQPSKNSAKKLNELNAKIFVIDTTCEKVRDIVFLSL